MLKEPLPSSSYSYAVSRSAELLTQYEELMEEKRIRDDACAFQALIDAQWDAYDEVYKRKKKIKKL